MKIVHLKAHHLLYLWLFVCLQSTLAQRNDHQQNRDEKREEGKRNLPRPKVNISDLYGSVLLGAPTDASIVVNVIAKGGTTIQVSWGTFESTLKNNTQHQTATTDGPLEFLLGHLSANTTYYYRISTSEAGRVSHSTISSFSTKKSTNQSFSFGLQGDSHPEREGKMFSPELYNITMQKAKDSNLDFYFLMGDDFSIDHLIQKGEVSQRSVEEVYLYQRKFATALGSTTPLFSVNGNHEQAAKYLLNNSDQSPAVLAANARKRLFPLPEPFGFYSGDTSKVANIGYLKDYYAFEWGDALFVVIDPYWHSENAVDNVPGDRTKKSNNGWNSTLGKEQYDWFCNTLAKSRAKYKFVFSHHVLGTGRGGIELAKLYEWGGENRRGEYEFDKMRPGFAKPIHQVMVDNKVTIFFQGHDHLFCQQELDGVTYQSVPIPADNSYQTFNADAYLSGKTLPNSGFLKVTVSPKNVKVDYIRSYLPNDQPKENSPSYSYTIKR